jgi:hypothetical protein
MKYVLKFEKYNESLSTNFANWFKNSQVVDKEGKPLVCYHGSKKEDLREFVKSTDIGYHFAVSKEIAKGMCGTYEDDYGFTGYIKPISCYLSIQKLGQLPDLEFWRKKDLLKCLDENPDIDFIYDDKESLLDNLKRFSFIISKLDGNYKDIDGFIYYNEYEGVGSIYNKTSYIILNSNQVKSTENDGSYDLNDNDIYS